MRSFSLEFEFSPNCTSTFSKRHEREASFRLTVGVNVSADGLSHCAGPVTNWRLVRLRPEPPGMDSINPCDLECGISGDGKWIDGWVTSGKCEDLVCGSALVVLQ